MYIYKIINSVNNNVYVGATSNVEARFKSHLREAKATTRKGREVILTHPLYSEMRTFGFDKFKIITIETVEKDNSLEREQFWVEKLNTLHPNGYNLTSGGEEGKVYSERTKELIGLETKKDWQDPELLKRMLSGLRKGTDTFVAQSKANREKVKEVAYEWAKNNSDLMLSLPGNRKKQELKPLWVHIEQETGMKDLETLNKSINGSTSTVVTFELLRKIAIANT